jgi:hypothetical protein
MVSDPRKNSAAACDGAKQHSLCDDDIRTRPTLGRRGALRLVGSTALAAIAGRSASAASRDDDAGQTADPPSPQMGSDRDDGAKADPPGSRRLRERGQRGPTDRDAGAKADPAGGGRGAASRSADADQGPKSDRASRQQR